jgi:glucose-6-phosphate 1-dehydrogenase
MSKCKLVCVAFDGEIQRERPEFETMEAAWEYVDPIIAGCGGSKQDLPTYPAGTWGPKEADDLIRADGRQWDVETSEPAG